MCLVKYFTMAFSVGSPVEIENLVPARQAQFQHIRVIRTLLRQRHAPNAMNMGHSCEHLEFFWNVLGVLPYRCF